MSLLRSSRHPLRGLALALALLGACSRERQEPAPSTPTAKDAPPAQAANTPESEPAAIAPEATPHAPNAAHGAELYGRMCAVCHGEKGEGYVADEATALAHPDFLGSVSDAYLTRAIRDGRTGTKMSAWHADRSGPLTSDDVGDVIAHLRSWQKQPALTLDERTPEGDVARGQALFQKTCASCHGGQGTNVRLLNPQLLVDASPGFLRHAIRKGRSGTKMIAYEKTLGERGVEDVVSYLASVPRWLAPEAYVGKGKPPPLPLGPVPLNPKGRDPKGFSAFPAMTSIAAIGPAYQQHARMALLDARPPSDYAQGHIAGAVSVPFYDPAPYLAALPKNAWLVCYCGCPHAESGSLARKLLDAGFTKVTVLDEGLGAWDAKGLPMREGIEP